MKLNVWLELLKKNIRFYEDQGLLSPRRNKENGYREYSDEDVSSLKQIKLLRKLGLPLEEIRLMQAGKSTVADSMKRHLITLEREKHNLAQSEMFCQRLKESDGSIVSLDADELLDEMIKLEAEGASFKNKQYNDIRIRYAAPIVAAIIMVIFMILLIAIMIWSFNTDPAGAPPLPMMILLFMAPGLVIIGVLLALGDRLKEIQKGEIDDARKY